MEDEKDITKHKCSKCGYEYEVDDGEGYIVIDTLPPVRCFYCPKCKQHDDKEVCC